MLVDDGNPQAADGRLLPADAHGEGSVAPVSPLDDGHFAAEVAPWAVEDLVRVAMLLGREPVGSIVRMRRAVV